MSAVEYRYIPKYLLTVAVLLFALDNLKGRDHSEDLGVDGRIILECIFISLRTGTFGFHRRR
jgi:hypothetical protein